MSDSGIEKPFKFTSEFILDQMERFYPPDKYAFFRELRVGTGYGKDSEGRIDAYSIHYMKGQRNSTTALEVKISVGDFRLELSKPLKRRPAMRLSNYFYFVCPKNMIKIEDIPNECGLIEVAENGETEVTIVAPYRESMPTWQFIASVCRRFDRERLSKHLTEGDTNYILRMHGSAVLEKLDEHIRRWESWRVGNKEVPDLIAGALKDVRSEVMEAIRENLKS